MRLVAYNFCGIFRQERGNLWDRVDSGWGCQRLRRIHQRMTMMAAIMVTMVELRRE